MKYQKLLSVLFCLLFCVQVSFSQDTYFITKEQLNSLIEQINNLKNNNENMKSLLELQTKEYETLEQNYLEKYLAIKKQQTNYQNLLEQYKSKSSIYKYSIVGALVVGFLAGVIVAK